MPQPRSVILSFGSVNIDVTARVTRLPAPGETIHGESYAIGLGGKGANQAAAAARLGAGLGLRGALAGRIGRDGFGVQARAALEAFGVDLSGLRVDADQPTGLAVIGVDAAGENCITVIGGANLAVTPRDVTASSAQFAEAAVLLLQLEVPLDAVRAAARQARKSGAVVVLDPAPAPETPLPDDLWSLVDLVTPNETETALLTGIHPDDQRSAAKAAGILVSRGAGGAIVKMGARGVWWQQGGEGGFVPPFAVTAVDTVAAGDCFNAGLAVGLASGRALPDAVRIAAACGALAVTRRGAAEAAPRWDEVEAIIAS